MRVPPTVIPKGGTKKRKRHTSEQIIKKLGLAEAEQASGTPLAEILKKLEVSEATFHR
jgi:putative transposase